jgi:sulfur carrier protein
MSMTSEAGTARATMLRVFVNDQPREISVDTSLAGLMRALGLAERKGIAAAHNGSVVPRADWATCRLTADDRVIVIQATQGG